ncbi:MAG: restriction endonuclease, partial [Betaproteobacteria bacterium]
MQRPSNAQDSFGAVQSIWIDVATVLAELRTGQRLGGTHHETFGLRDEQLDAVNKTRDYYQSIWAEDVFAAPRFLWNAKMRFGKTFATYQ